MTELKPCPFCGETTLGASSQVNGHATVGHYIECGHCQNQGPWMFSASAAADAWNNRVSPWRSLKDDPPEPPTEATNHAILIRNLGRELVDNRYHQLVPYNDMDNGGVLRWFEVHLDWVLEDYLDRGFSEWMEVPE